MIEACHEKKLCKQLEEEERGVQSALSVGGKRNARLFLFLVRCSSHEVQMSPKRRGDHLLFLVLDVDS